jgi:hypothetical protein
VYSFLEGMDASDEMIILGYFNLPLRKPVPEHATDAVAGAS